MASLLPCPFCGARPHQGADKVQYDQLHGEPFQTYSVWCPHLCAKKGGVNKDLAISEWNRRAPVDPAKDALVAELVGELKTFMLIADAEQWGERPGDHPMREAVRRRAREILDKARTHASTEGE